MERQILLYDTSPFRSYTELCDILITLCEIIISPCDDWISLCDNLISSCSNLISLCGNLISLCGNLISLSGDLIALYGYLVLLCANLVFCTVWDFINKIGKYTINYMVTIERIFYLLWKVDVRRGNTLKTK